MPEGSGHEYIKTCKRVDCINPYHVSRKINEDKENDFCTDNSANDMVNTTMNVQPFMTQQNSSIVLMNSFKNISNKNQAKTGKIRCCVCSQETIFPLKDWIENFETLGFYMMCKNCQNTEAFDLTTEHMSSFILYVNTNMTPFQHQYVPNINQENRGKKREFDIKTENYDEPLAKKLICAVKNELQI